MGNKTRAGLLALAAAGAVAFGSGCSTVAEPDQIILYYTGGSSDGSRFVGCIEPSTNGSQPLNDTTIVLPDNARTWNIAKEGGDTNVPTTVQSAPEKDQPSGVQVNVWSQTLFDLNTNCDDSPDSPLVTWWETLGRRYGADTAEGWRSMLYATLIPTLNKSILDVVRSFPADALVAGTALPEAQQKIALRFQEELRRMTGDHDWFCGPAFVRGNPDCPPIEILITDVDYTDAGIQEARNAKQKAIEAAAAAVAEAQGKVAAANAQNALYQNGPWLELEKAKLELEKVKACAAAPNCTLFLGDPPPGTILQPR